MRIDLAEELNVVIAGVGGQGNLLLSEILAEAALREGHNVVGCELLGASQRGGSVVGHLRIGPDVFSPMIPSSKANILICLEPGEGLRAAIRYMAPQASVIINKRFLPSTSINLGQCACPRIRKIVELIEKLGGKVLLLDASLIAEELGDPIMMNIVMLGALASTGWLRVQTLKELVSEHVPEKVLEPNLKAFEAGYAEAARQASARGFEVARARRKIRARKAYQHK